MAASARLTLDGTDVPDDLTEVLDGPFLQARFQPIVDLLTARPVGYEVLCRPTVGTTGIEQLFHLAKRHALSWDLERACRVTALGRIAELGARAPGTRFFLNVSPDILGDPRFIEGFTRTQLNRYGIELQDIVIEITERESVENYATFERLLRHYEAQGFHIALDDFGSGHSSLVTLISSVPHYLKLDKELVRDLHRRPYKQRLVRSLVSFAASVETKIIAEGVEKWAELEILSRLGVRLGQGYLFARPEVEPPALPNDVRERLLDTRRQNDSRQSVLSATVLHLLDRCPTLEAGELNCAQLEDAFQADATIDHMVLVEDDAPVGLITSQDLLRRTSGPVGRSLHSRKPAEVLAKRDALTVSGQAGVEAVAQLALERQRQDTYDPVIVVDDAGRFLGTVTVKQLLATMSELSEHEAAGANALTGLPGQRTVDKWLAENLEEDFTLVFADLDRFREFNVAYGFLAGDELIRLASSVLQSVVEEAGPHAKLGHVGADNFIILSPSPIDDLALEEACATFDARRREYFSADDVTRGTMRLPAREGSSREVALTALSLAVLGRDRFDDVPHPGHLAQVGTSLKRKLRELTHQDGRSRYLRERRVHHVGRRLGPWSGSDSIPPSLSPAMASLVPHAPTDTESEPPAAYCSQGSEAPAVSTLPPSGRVTLVPGATSLATEDADAEDTEVTMQSRPPSF